MTRNVEMLVRAAEALGEFKDEARVSAAAAGCPAVRCHALQACPRAVILQV